MGYQNIDTDHKYTVVAMCYKSLVYKQNFKVKQNNSSMTIVHELNHMVHLMHNFRNIIFTHYLSLKAVDSPDDSPFPITLGMGFTGVTDS